MDTSQLTNGQRPIGLAEIAKQSEVYTETEHGNEKTLYRSVTGRKMQYAVSTLTEFANSIKVSWGD